MSSILHDVDAFKTRIFEEEPHDRIFDMLLRAVTPNMVELLPEVAKLVENFTAQQFRNIGVNKKLFKKKYRLLHAIFTRNVAGRQFLYTTYTDDFMKTSILATLLDYPEVWSIFTSPEFDQKIHQTIQAKGGIHRNPIHTDTDSEEEEEEEAKEGEDNTDP